MHRCVCTPVHSFKLKSFGLVFGKIILLIGSDGVNNNKKKTVEYGKYGVLFIAPFFIVFLVFQFYPLIYTIFKSFMFDKKTGRKKVVTEFGLGNYINYVFGGNGEVWQAMLITIVLWLLNFIPQLLLSLNVILLWRPLMTQQQNLKALE